MLNRFTQVGLLILVLSFLILSCTKSEVKSGSKLSKILSKYMGKSDAVILKIDYTGKLADYKAINIVDLQKNDVPEIALALKGSDEAKLLKALQAKNIKVLAIDSDPDKDFDLSGSVLESMNHAGELDLFSIIYMDKDITLVAPTAKAYMLTSNEQKQLIAYIRSKLAGDKAAVAPSQLKTSLNHRAIIDLRLSDDGGYNKGVGLVRGRGKTVLEAIDQAITKASDRYAKKGGGFNADPIDSYIKEAIITINIYRERGELLGMSGRLSRKLSLGLDGLIISYPKGGKRSTIIISPDKSKIYRAKSITNLIEIAVKGAGKEKDSYKVKGVTILKFRTLDLTERTPGGEVIKLFRGNEYIDPAKLDRKEIETGFKTGAEWLLSILDDETGIFKYEYYATKNKYRVNKYNLIRHGLAVLTLIQAYELYGEERFLAGAKVAIEYVLSLTEYEGDMAYFRHKKYDPRYKLGGAGVMVQGMCEYYRLKKMPEWEKAMKGLGNFMVHLQKENGHYNSFYAKPGKKASTKEVTIYPGEANLALVRLYKIFGDKKYLDTVDKAFKYYSKWFNDKKSPRSKGNLGAFVPWDMSAMQEFWEVVKRDDVAEYAYQMADWLIDNWFIYGHKETYWKDHVGGVHTSSRKTNMPIWNAGVYGEGIASVYRIAVQKGDIEKMKKYRRVSFLIMRYIRQIQYKQGSAYYLPSPSSAIGAIPSNFHQDDCRLDYAYHCLTVNYRALRFFDANDWKELREGK